MNKAIIGAAAMAFALCTHVSAESLSACNDDASRVRYADENVCYENHGPKTAEYDTRNTQPLDACLDGAHAEFSATVEQCGEMYMVEAGESPNYPAAGTILGTIFLFAL